MTKNWKRWVQIGMLVLAPGMARADAAGLVGNWVRTTGTVRIAVTPCGTNFCAVNTWVKRPDGPEKKGDELVLTVKPVSSTELDGQAYDVRRQRTYKMTVTLLGNGDMTTSGCVLLGIICKSTEWKRDN